MTKTNAHPAVLPEDRLLKDCRESRVRRSGPGGQHRNKVETGIVLEHGPTGVRAEAAERRSQQANRKTAVRRLRVQLALDVREEVEPDAEPSPLWRSRCRNGRVSVNRDHDDFPALLAEALDRVRTCDGRTSEAAEALDCTASQLVKLLKREPRALALVNAWRKEAGAAPLR